MNRVVYLYGPITGLSYGAAEDWRGWMKSELAKHNITALSPLRFKDYLANLKEISGHGREYAELGVLSTSPAVLARDKFDVHRSAVLAGNFLGADRVSIGSMFEQAWAHHAHIPVAVAVEKQGNPHDHMFFNQTVNFRVETLEALRDTVIAILG